VGDPEASAEGGTRADAPGKPFRVLPRVTPWNEHFWRGGAVGELRFLRCRACGTWIHPPSPRCPACLGADVAPAAVSGRARVLTYTLNHQQWVPSPDHPYAIAIVEIEEQPGLRLMTNVVNCPAESVRIGMPVRVCFERHADVWVPLFEPEPGASA
jgi:uncharacterized OB-fold protein